MEGVTPPVIAEAPAPALAVEKTEGQKRLEVRIWCAFVLTICAAIFSLAGYLTPKEGLHQKFGMPECGMLKTTGVPCPTCGCTTAVTYFAHGHPLLSLYTQPFGFTFALVAFLLLPLTGWGLVTGRWKGPSMFWLSWHWPYWVYSLVGVLAVGWVWRVMLVEKGWTL